MRMDLNKNDIVGYIWTFLVLTATFQLGNCFFKFSDAPFLHEA